MNKPLQPSTASILKSFDLISSLAKVERHNGMPFDTKRKENVTEHSYSLATLGCALAHEIGKNSTTPLDIGKIAQFALVHDLLEALTATGDISVYASSDIQASKESEEKAAFEQLKKQTNALPWIAQTIKDYEDRNCPEARYVYALDKIIVHMIIVLNNEHHVRPTFERYLETEVVARQKIHQSFPELLPYFEDLCQMFRDRPHLFSSKIT